MDKDTVTLNKIATTMFKPTEAYSNTVTISKERYKKLCEKYGTYKISWYFTETGNIKYFNGEGWYYD